MYVMLLWCINPPTAINGVEGDTAECQAPSQKLALPVRQDGSTAVKVVGTRAGEGQEGKLRHV